MWNIFHAFIIDHVVAYYVGLLYIFFNVLNLVELRLEGQFVALVVLNWLFGEAYTSLFELIEQTP